MFRRTSWIILAIAFTFVALSGVLLERKGVNAAMFASRTTAADAQVMTLMSASAQLTSTTEISQTSDVTPTAEVTATAEATSTTEMTSTVQATPTTEVTPTPTRQPLPPQPASSQPVGAVGVIDL